MPKITFKAGDEYALKLSRLAGKSDGVAKRAIYKGAEIVTDAIKQNLENIPTEKARWLQPGEQFDGLTENQKKALANGFGLTKMEQDESGNWNTKAGFEGYVNSRPTKNYPKGLPIPMLARALERGTSVRRKHPFNRPAVAASKKAAEEAMNRSINEDIEKIMKK